MGGCSLTPYDIYMKTLYALVKDRLEDEDERDILWDDDIMRKLADFQKVAVRQARADHARLRWCVRCGRGRARQELYWRSHREALRAHRPRSSADHLSRTAGRDVGTLQRAYQLNAKVLSMGYLYEGDNGKGNILLDRREVSRPRLCPGR